MNECECLAIIVEDGFYQNGVVDYGREVITLNSNVDSISRFGRLPRNYSVSVLSWF